MSGLDSLSVGYLHVATGWGVPRETDERIGTARMATMLAAQTTIERLCMEEDKRNELLKAARSYIDARNNAEERGLRLATMLAERPASDSQIVEFDGKFYEISRVYSPSAGELPVRVRKADILGLV